MPELESPLSDASSALRLWSASYRNTRADNERVFAAFTRSTDVLPWLKRHRDWIEARRFGYGQRAFHYSWWLLVSEIVHAGLPVDMLEIGVFKGQTISLVALCARQLGVAARIVAVSPFRGNYAPGRRWRLALDVLLDAELRRQRRLGNLHPDGDHLADAARLFAEFGLDFSLVTPVRGLSTDPDVIERVSAQRFSLVFIDGDHSYEAASSDIEHYTPLVRRGGYAVVDDAAAFLPGSGYFKGMKSVSRACRLLEASPAFRNVLNVGHNRIFQHVTD